ncbi:MAG: hypothetical protein Q9218_001831 [Villophora microphyllina]
MAKMTALVSFSFSIDKFPSHERTSEDTRRPEGSCMRSEVIAKLLDALPNSCVDLDLDTGGREDDQDCGFHDSMWCDHLCTAVRGLLPRLRHLRLRLGSLCANLFLEKHGDRYRKVRAENLLSIGINFCDLTEDCAEHGKMYTPGREAAEIELSEMGYNAVIQANRAELSPDDIRMVQLGVGAILREGCTGGMASVYPQLKAAQTINSYVDKGYQYEYVLQDLIKDMIHIFPFELIWSDNTKFDDRTYLGKDKGGDEYMGSMTILEQILEGGSWVTAIDGSRWSLDLWLSPTFQCCSLPTPRFETGNDSLKRCESRLPPESVNAYERSRSNRTKTHEGLYDWL